MQFQCPNPGKAPMSKFPESFHSTFPTLGSLLSAWWCNHSWTCSVKPSDKAQSLCAVPLLLYRHRSHTEIVPASLRGGMREKVQQRSLLMPQSALENGVSGATRSGCGATSSLKSLVQTGACGANNVIRQGSPTVRSLPTWGNAREACLDESGSGHDA